MDKTFIFGHKNPDTDSICSAMALANLRSKLGEEVEATRLGELNKETEYAFKTFNIKAPRLLEKIKDSQNEETVSIANALKEKEIIKEDEENYDKYYVWNQQLLDELGLDNLENNILVINYATLEIIIPNGIQLEENGETLYKFSDIQSRI